MQASKTYVEADWSVGNVTSPLAMDWRGGPVACQITITGTIDIDIQSSNSDLQAGQAGDWLVDSATVTGVTASKWVTFNPVPRFIRLDVNSFTTGATVTLKLTQSNV
jgi:hypothetical protein